MPPHPHHSSLSTADITAALSCAVHDKLMAKCVEFCDKITAQFPSPEDPRSPIELDGSFEGTLLPDQADGKRAWSVPIPWRDEMYAGCKLRFPSQGGVPILTFNAPSPAVPTFQLKVVAEGESLCLTGLQLLGGARPVVAAPTAAAA